MYIMNNTSKNIMSKDVMKFLMAGHDLIEQIKIKEQIEFAELMNYKKYVIYLKEGFYKIENGQIVIHFKYI